MQDITQVPLDRLEWVNTGKDDSFELKAGTQVVAELTWERGTETVAHVRSSYGRWTVRRRGFLAPAVAVRDTDAEKELAVLRVRWRESILHVADGATYRWVDTGFWVPRWKFTDANGGDLVKFEPRQGHGRSLERGVVICSAAVTAGIELFLLLTLGWYFIVLVWAEQEGESIGAIVTTLAGG
jgi:hypothetical protein